MAEEERPDEKALTEVHTEIERRDEQQIVEYLAGGVVDEYVYAFRDKGGRMQVGLSWAGTREMAQGRGNIRIEEEPHITEHDDHWRGMALAVDTERNVALWGGCHQTKKMMIHVQGPKGEDTGETTHIDDPFAYEKCIAKCQRNALKAIMPVTSITRFIIHFCETNKIQLPERLKKTQLKTLKGAPGKMAATRSQRPAIAHIEKTAEEITRESEQIPAPEDTMADIGTAWDDSRRLTTELNIKQDKLQIWWDQYAVEVTLEDFKLQDIPERFKADQIFNYRRSLMLLAAQRDKRKQAPSK